SGSDRTCRRGPWWRHGRRRRRHLGLGRGLAGVVVGDDSANGGENLLHRRFLRPCRLRHSRTPNFGPPGPKFQSHTLVPPIRSATDLTFPHHPLGQERQIESGTRITRAARAPLFPKFVSECAETDHKLRKRSARSESATLPLAGRKQYGKSKCERKDLWCLATALCITARQACERPSSCHGPGDSASPHRKFGP